MNQGLIPGRYAKALYAFASEKGAQKRVYELACNLESSFASEPALRQAVANPFISDADKVKLLVTASGAESSDNVFDDILKLLADNNRIALAREIAIAYMQIYRKANNIRLVTVTSASAMTPDEELRLKNLIEKHIGGATMEYHSEVNPDLIGGFTVSVDNEKLDASVANELKQLRLKLLN